MLAALTADSRLSQTCVSPRPNDAEHPTVIPMYTMMTPQDPRGHMMRPQIYAIGHKVILLLSEPSLSTCETWLLPQTYVLCMTRNQEEGHGIATSIGQDGEDTKREEQEEELLGSYSARTSDSLRTTDNLRTSDAWRLHQPDRPQPRQPTAPGRPPHTGRPMTPRATDDRRHLTSNRLAPEPKLWMSDISARPDRPEAPDD